MDKTPLEVKSYNVEDERRFKDLTARVVSLEYWRGAAQADMVKRIEALEARCHELEHNRASVQEQIADLQARVVALATQRWYFAARVAALEAQTVDLQQRVKDLENQRPVKPEPELVYSYDSEPAPASPEVAIPDQITIDSMAHLEPEPAIPDVPMAVGTERFQARLRGHIQELGGAYSWGAGHPVEWMDDYLERLAGVACTLRDAYELARTGEHVAAQEKLEEISW